MKHITLTDEQYEQLLDELNSLTSYHLNDDTVHSSSCGSKVLSVIEAGVTESFLTERQSEAVQCMFEEWFAGDMSLPSKVAYTDAIEAMHKLGLGGQASLINKFCKGLEDPGWEQLSDYHGDDRYSP